MCDVKGLENAKLFERISADASDTFTVIGLDKSKAYIQAIGDGGCEAVKALLKDDQIQFFVIRVMGVDPKGSVVSRRAKFVFGQWVGSGITAFKRMSASTAKSAIGSYFRGHHLSLEISDREDINEVDIEKRLRACGGAHQPDHFEFGSGTSVATYDVSSQPTGEGVKGAPTAAAPTSPRTPSSGGAGARGGAGATASSSSAADAAAAKKKADEEAAAAKKKAEEEATAAAAAEAARKRAEEEAAAAAAKKRAEEEAAAAAAKKRAEEEAAAAAAKKRAEEEAAAAAAAEAEAQAAAEATAKQAEQEAQAAATAAAETETTEAPAPEAAAESSEAAPEAETAAE